MHVLAQTLTDSTFWDTTIQPALHAIGIVIIIASILNAAKKALADKSGGWVSGLVVGFMLGSVIYGIGDLLGDGSIDIGGPGKAIFKFFWDFVGGGTAETPTGGGLSER